MRATLISDIHGNEIALRAVLEAVQRLGTDRIVCLGDVATLGPYPEESLALLRDQDLPCVQGNHDIYMIDPNLTRSYSADPEVLDAIAWCHDQLSHTNLEFAGTFRNTIVVELASGAYLLLFHGSRCSPTDEILATAPGDQLDVMLNAERHAVMACGHTHLQMIRQHHGMLVINVGSVGMPFHEYANGSQPVLMDHAEFTTIESTLAALSVTRHRVRLNRDALRAAAASTANPLRAWLVAQYS